MQYTDKDRKVLDDAVSEMMERLENEVMKDYKAGISIEDEYCALIEKVGGQKTSLVGINVSSGLPVMHEIEEELNHDHNLVFSTDSHEDPVDLNSANRLSYEKDKIMEIVEEAESQLESTKAGIGERTVTNIEVLGIDGDYVLGTVNLLSLLLAIIISLYIAAIIAISFLMF